MTPERLKQIILALAAVFGLALAWGAWERGRAERLGKDAAEALGRARSLKAQAEQAEHEAQIQRVNARIQAAENEILREVLAKAPRPPAPKPPPADLNPALAARGVLTPLPRIEGELVWNWSEEALRVPALTTRLDAAEALVTGQGKEIATLRGEADALDAARTKWKAAHDAQEDRAKALEGQIGAITREQRSREVRWWIKLGAGVAGAYVLGRATR